MPNVKIDRARLLAEQSLDGNERPGKRPARSVTRNLAESPLGWLFARGHVSRRQFDAGERLRFDWERSRLSPRVTMSWDAAPIARSRGGASPGIDLNGSQLDAKRRFEKAVADAGPGREAETALGWPARAGKLVLGLALDRVADYYRIK